MEFDNILTLLFRISLVMIILGVLFSGLWKTWIAVVIYIIAIENFFTMIGYLSIFIGVTLFVIVIILYALFDS